MTGVHWHVAEEWKGLAPNPVATLRSRFDALAVLEQGVDTLQRVIGLKPRDRAIHPGLVVQILDSDTDGWITVRAWKCEGERCGLMGTEPAPQFHY